jgi:hypothetical protein
MNVLLGGVDGLAPEVLGHRLWADTCERPKKVERNHVSVNNRAEKEEGEWDRNVKTRLGN